MKTILTSTMTDEQFSKFRAFIRDEGPPNIEVQVVKNIAMVKSDDEKSIGIVCNFFDSIKVEYTVTLEGEEKPGMFDWFTSLFK